MPEAQVETRTLPAQTTAIRSGTLSIDALPKWLGETYETVAKHITAVGGVPDGPPFARFHPRDDGRFDVTAGFPVQTAVAGQGSVQPGNLPGGTAAVVLHVGPYEEMGASYETLAAWLTSHAAKPVGDPWEVYRTEPSTDSDPADWRTEIVQSFRSDTDKDR